jgi:hypothetical protein
MSSVFRGPAIVLVAVFALAACGGAGIGTTVPQGAMSQSRAHKASGSYNCPSNPKGTGILPDGDFSQVADESYGYKKDQIFAPSWEVSKGTIDFYASTGPSNPGLDGLCWVDMDGYTAGGIRSSGFSTKPGQMYMLSFLFSGNGGSGPTIKTLKVSIDHQFTQFTWNISGGNDLGNGDYTIATWKFRSTGKFAVLTFTSLDPRKSLSGAAVGGIAVTKS